MAAASKAEQPRPAHASGEASPRHERMRAKREEGRREEKKK